MVSGMRFFLFILVFIFTLNQNVKANAFTEIFGSEGAAGIKNPKIRSLSYAFQYLTFTGSIGYVGKQLFDSGFLSPLGLTPESINNLSPLGYKDNFTIKVTKKIRLKTGDCVHIPAMKLHTHGSTNKKTNFSHIAINSFPRKNKEPKTVWYDSDFKQSVTRVLK